jgi:hypothetical protein
VLPALRNRLRLHEYLETLYSSLIDCLCQEIAFDR